MRNDNVLFSYPGLYLFLVVLIFLCRPLTAQSVRTSSSSSVSGVEVSQHPASPSTDANALKLLTCVVLFNYMLPSSPADTFKMSKLRFPLLFLFPVLLDTSVLFRAVNSSSQHFIFIPFK